MRKVSLVLVVLSLASLYLFACGALNIPPGSGYPERFLERALLPIRGATPLGGGVLVGAAVLLACAVGARSSAAPERRTGTVLTWPSVLNAAFFAASLAVAGTALALLLGPALRHGPAQTGLLYAAALVEALLGGALLAALLFLERPRLIFLPSLGLLVVGTSLLGALLWLGSGTG